MTQEQLRNTVIGVMVAVVFIGCLISRTVLNIVTFVLIASAVVCLPFWLDSLIRFKFIPWVDSLNTDRHEDFSYEMRATIWGFLGVVFAFLWSWIIPILLGLPLWIGRLMMNMGWDSLPSTDFRWQYGWMIIFIIQYLVDFGVGASINNEIDITERFDYPNE